MTFMKTFVVATLCLLPLQAVAEEDNGTNLMRRGAEMFLKGLEQQMEPALEDLRALTDELGPQMQDFFQEMGPAFRDLLDEVEDWSLYHAPEVLPNGDIILRRRQPDEPAPEESETPGDQVDL